VDAGESVVTMPMKLKLSSEGNVVVQDGKPVYDDNGRDVAFDYDATLATISRLNGEAKGHREAKEALEEKLKVFDGLDPESARKALDTVKNLDDKKLIDAGEVERVKKEAQDAYAEQLRNQEKKYKPVVEERDSLKSALHQEKISTAFNRSKFIQEKVAIPLDMVQSKFGSNFFFEDGKIKAKGQDGNPVYSKANPGNLAEFDEALEILVDSYSFKDNILKGSGASGGGAGGTKTGTDGKKQMTRAQFDALDPAAKVAAVKDTAIVD
jgi:hypothetical protein